MPIEIEAPDGSVVEFPDGTDEATITRAMQQAYGAPQSGGAGAGLGDRAAAAPLRHADGRLTEAGWDAERAATAQRRQEEIDEGSFLGNLVAGYGRSAPGLYHGGKQLAMETIADRADDIGRFAEWVGLPRADEARAKTNRFLGDIVSDLRQETAQERRDSAGLMSTGGGILGNLLGDAITTLPLAGVGVAPRGAGIAKAVGQAALGGAAQGALQPVAAEGERETNALIGAGVGGGLAGSGRAVMRLGEEALPSNAVSRVLNQFGKKANETPFAQEGEALAQRTGIDLSPGAISGSRAQTAAENMARQSVFSADKAFRADERVAEQAIAHINRVMDRVSKTSGSAEGIGDQVQGTVRKAVQQIHEQREVNAAKQYGAIRKMIGDAPVVTYDNTRKTLERIIAENTDVIGTDASRIRSQAQSLLEEIAQKEGYSLDAARRARSFYGSAAKRSANIFDNVNPATNAVLAKRLFGAMSDDIEAAAGRIDEAAGFGKNAAVPAGVIAQKPSEMLRQANDEYRQFSKLLDAVKASPLKRLLGDEINVDDFMTVNTLPPETVIARMGSMKGSEIDFVKNFMQNNAPDTWQQYKRMLLDDALSQAQTFPASAGARTLPYNAGGFVRALGGDKPDKIERLRRIFDNEEMSEIDDALAAARRLGDKFGANFSGTGPYNEVANAMRDLTIRGVATTASTVTGFNRVAQLMLDSKGRRALIDLARLPPGTRKANDAAAYLASILAINANEGDGEGLNIDIVGGRVGDAPTEEELQRLRQGQQR